MLGDVGLWDGLVTLAAREDARHPGMTYARGVNELVRVYRELGLRGRGVWLGRNG
jgi:hypothetical protein